MAVWKGVVAVGSEVGSIVEIPGEELVVVTGVAEQAVVARVKTRVTMTKRILFQPLLDNTITYNSFLRLVHFRKVKKAKSDYLP